MGKVTHTRCKVRVQKVEEHKDHTGKVYAKSVTVGAPPYDPDPESDNGRFFAATPCINMTLHVLNLAAADAFEEGKDYYVDFSPVQVDDAG